MPVVYLLSHALASSALLFFFFVVFLVLPYRFVLRIIKIRVVEIDRGLSIMGSCSCTTWQLCRDGPASYVTIKVYSMVTINTMILSYKYLSTSEHSYEYNIQFLLIEPPLIIHSGLLLWDT